MEVGHDGRDSFRRTLVGKVQPWNSVIGSAAGGGSSMAFSCDSGRKRLTLGRPADNIVSVLMMDQIFASGVE